MTDQPKVGWKSKLTEGRAAAWKWYRDHFRTKEFYEVMTTFCAEAAVLWLVFPLVDQLGKRPPERFWGWVIASPLIAIAFLTAAGILSKKSKDKEGGHI